MSREAAHSEASRGGHGDQQPIAVNDDAGEGGFPIDLHQKFNSTTNAQ